jgi:hypothetical protein
MIMYKKSYMTNLQTEEPRLFSFPAGCGILKLRSFIVSERAMPRNSEKPPERLNLLNEAFPKLQFLGKQP